MKDHIELRRPSVKNAAKRLARYGYQKVQVRKPERYANSKSKRGLTTGELYADLAKYQK